MKTLALICAAFLTLAPVAEAQVPVSGLPSATTPLSGAEFVPCVQSSVTKKCATLDIGNAILTGGNLGITPQAYGALANSNLTPGNGHDDTSAISSAIAAAAAQNDSRSLSGGTVYFPCGNYRVTSTISWTSTVASIHLKGEGACSKIYNDAGSAFTTFAFNGGTCANSVAPCVTVEDLNFVRPTTTSASAFAATFIGVSSPEFLHNIVNGYGRGLNFTTSYGPHIIGNTFSAILGAAVVCSNDVSCNNGLIWANRTFFVGSTISEASFEFGDSSVTDCVSNITNLSFIGNDIESGYAGPQFLGVCGLTIQDNYIASNSSFPFNFGTGLNQAIKVSGNYFGENGAATPWAFSLSNVTGIDFGPNAWFHQQMNFGTGLSGVTYSGVQSLTGSATVANYCTTSMNCASLPGGWLREWGEALTAGSGSVAVTFPVACPTNNPAEVAAVNDNGTNVDVWSSAISKTGMTINSSPSPAFTSWSITCN